MKPSSQNHCRLLLFLLAFAALCSTGCSDNSTPGGDDRIDAGRDSGDDSGDDLGDNPGDEAGDDRGGDNGSDPDHPTDLGDDGGDETSDDGGDPRPWRVGAADTLEIVTWNLREFPLNSSTPQKVATLISEMDIDLVAVQEITDVTAFNELLVNLPSHQGVLSTDEYFPGSYQKTAFIYRTNQIRIHDVASILEGDSYAFPRPPLQALAEVSPPDGKSFALVLIGFHLKANVGAEDEARRRDAIVKLKTHVDSMLLASPNTKVVLLGDFNDNPTDPPANNVFEALLNDPNRYTILTLPVAQSGDYSYIPYQEMIDQLVITSTLAPEYKGGRTFVVPLEQEINEYRYEDEVSDHRPVVSVFPLP